MNDWFNNVSIITTEWQRTEHVTTRSTLSVVQITGPLSNQADIDLLAEPPYTCTISYHFVCQKIKKFQQSNLSITEHEK